jgi:hypothetical protein
MDGGSDADPQTGCLPACWPPSSQWRGSPARLEDFEGDPLEDDPMLEHDGFDDDWDEDAS